MATVINNPDTSGGNGVGVIVGVIVAIVLVALVILYVVPALRNNSRDSGDTTVQVPDQIDVNVNKQ